MSYRISESIIFKNEYSHGWLKWIEKNFYFKLYFAATKSRCYLCGVKLNNNKMFHDDFGPYCRNTNRCDNRVLDMGGTKIGRRILRSRMYKV